jgi:hypothetical protein
MSQERTPRTSGANPERIVRPRLRRTARRGGGQAWNLRFESADTRVPAAIVGQRPSLLVAAVEDVCWRVAMDACRASRPGRWRRRAYAAWAAQLRGLEEKRERLRSLVEQELLAW